MTRKDWIGLTPALLLATGVLVSTAVAVWASDFGRLVALAAPLLLTLTILGADALDSRLRGGAAIPSWNALLLGAANLLACLTVALVDPEQVAMMIPLLGGACAGTMVALNARGRRTACR